MPSFLSRLILNFFGCEPDAKIIGDVKFYSSCIPYFTVKMKGCRLPVDISAEDISEKFTLKFNQEDIKKATKVCSRYKKLSKLLSIEGYNAILYGAADKSYQIINIYNDNLAQTLNFDIIGADDAFKLGVHFERMRQIKNRNLMDMTKQATHSAPLYLVNADDR